jgi:hypothetical protein
MRGKASSPPRFGERQKNGRLNFDGHRKSPNRKSRINIQQAAHFARCLLEPAKP